MKKKVLFTSLGTTIINKATLLITALFIIGTLIWLLPKTNPGNHLIVGTNSGFPPYETMDEQGNIIGFDIDIAQHIADKMGKQLELKDMSFDALIVALQQGKIDCAIAGISITTSRKKEITLIHYTGSPLTELPLVFWNTIPEGVKTINDIQHLNNTTICAQAGTLQQEIISTYPGIEVKHLENIPDLIMDIKYGKSIATVLETKVAHALQAQHPELKILMVPLKPEQQDFGSGIGINKNNRKLIEKISTIISELKANGTIAQLETKWFKERNNNDLQ